MFELTCAWRELTRRWPRALLPVLALGTAVAVVAATGGLVAGLREGQERLAHPLRQVGADLLVLGAGPAGPAGGLVTDLARLGRPGERFVRDTFLPGALPPLPAEAAARIASLSGVAEARGLLALTVVHQEGTIPRLAAEVRTGGETLRVTREIEPLTDAERERLSQALQTALARLAASGLAPFTPEWYAQVWDAVDAALPERFRRVEASVQAPEQVVRQELGPPATDLVTDTFTVLGADRETFAAIARSGRIAAGRVLSGEPGEAVVASGFARARGLEPGESLVVRGRTLRVVGVIQGVIPAADVYLSLTELQQLAEMPGAVNLVLVRAVEGEQVPALAAAIPRTLPGVAVAGDAELGPQVAGALAGLVAVARGVGVALSALALAAAALIAAVLAMAGVQRRVRELGTLKALGWSPVRIASVLLAEAGVQGLGGGAVGLGAGWAVLAGLDRAGLTLAAGAPAWLPGAAPVAGAALPQAEVALRLSLPLPLAGAAAALAVAAALLAGAAAAAWALRLRPADALRDPG